MLEVIADPSGIVPELDVPTKVAVYQKYHVEHLTTINSVGARQIKLR